MAGLEGITLGRYELHRLVGRGGMADVYEGYDPHIDRKVAVKVFRREDEEMLRRFIHEAHLMASLRNEHLVQVYDAGHSEIRDIDWYYIVMPFMEGGTLRARVRRSPLTPTEACRNLKDIASALDYIHHQGIVHRDIKSSNVLLDAEGRCYLSDFGIARTATDVTQMTTTGNVLGTVDYVAPELFEVGRKADDRSDLYSLGVLLFEMVTGQLPFSADNQIALVSMHMYRPPPSPRSISQNISPLAERVIFKALEKKPELRYSSAVDLADAFCHAVAGTISMKASSMQVPPEAVGIKPNQVVLPPLLPNAPKSSRLRQVPLESSTEAPPSVPPSQRPASSVPLPAPPIPRATANLPGGGKGPPSTRPREERRRKPIIALLALLALLLVIGSTVYLLVTQSNSRQTSTGTPTPTQAQRATTGTTPTLTPTATPNLTATAHAIVVATATARAQATATAIAGVTATAQAQASATAGVIQTATAGQPVYQDQLNDPKNAATKSAQWDQNSNCAFRSDGYHVTQTTGLINLHGCRESANAFNNAAISVDMKILSGHSGGLFFRLSTDFLGNYSGYVFEVDSQGNYKLSTISSGAVTPLAGHDWTKTSALSQGLNVKNTLQVIMNGNTFLFYANGIFLAQVTDTTFGAAGDIGFLATATTTNADIVYNNLAVYPHP